MHSMLHSPVPIIQYKWHLTFAIVAAIRKQRRRDLVVVVVLVDTIAAVVVVVVVVLMAEALVLLGVDVVEMEEVVDLIPTRGYKGARFLRTWDVTTCRREFLL